MPENKHNLAPGNVRFWNDPAIRSLVFQAILFLAVFAVGYVIYQNTQNNLDSRGITTGFEFLSVEAGFGIIQSLIPYDESHSYGRTFIVGLLNTLLVSILGVFFATILGFLIGVARLSSNWLVSRIAAVYIEIFRNIPLLLQILFWYFIVGKFLPGPRESYNLAETIFLNKRGLYLPSPIFDNGAVWILAALVIAVLIVFFIKRWAKQRQNETGDQFPIFLVSLGVMIGLPLVVFLLSGTSLHWDIPEFKGFNFRGGVTIFPELSALLIALTIYTAAFIAEIVRSGILSISKGQTEAAHALGISPGKTLQLIIIPQALRVIIPPLTSQYLKFHHSSNKKASFLVC